MAPKLSSAASAGIGSIRLEGGQSRHRLGSEPWIGATTTPSTTATMVRSRRDLAVGPGSREGPLATQLGRFFKRRWMTASGHEDQFPPCQLNARCVFREETFAEARANGRDAPIPATPASPGYHVDLSGPDFGDADIRSWLIVFGFSAPPDFATGHLLTVPSSSFVAPVLSFRRNWRLGTRRPARFPMPDSRWGP